MKKLLSDIANGQRKLEPIQLNMLLLFDLRQNIVIYVYFTYINFYRMHLRDQNVDNIIIALEKHQILSNLHNHQRGIHRKRY